MQSTAEDAAGPKLVITQRKDVWWVEPLIVAAFLSLWLIYATWAALQGKNYEWGPYLSPFYSPLLQFSWWHFSPSLLILWAPGGFRITCYYYRKAYYRAFTWDPPACAVEEARGKKYCGETTFPLILQNLHRYFMYLALLILVILWVDVYKAFFFDDGFGMGLGTLVLFVNSFLLSLYTFSCHSLRHLVGGKLDCFSCASLGSARHGVWKGVSVLNVNHMLWAWLSLFWVAFSDLYVRLLAMGVFRDIRIL